MLHLRFLCTLLFFGIFAQSSGLAATPARPNILLVLTDDQGHGDFSLHGNPYLKTPVGDRFATEGIQFSRFFVSPLCAPTRASLLTGRWSLRCGVWGVTHNQEAMRPSEVTIAEALKTAGYHTGCFGKWHNGEQFPYTPPGQGFDEFFGFHNGHWNNYFDTKLLQGSQFVDTKGYLPDVLTDHAIQFMERYQKEPFFCYVPLNVPHAPFQVPDRYFDKYKAMGLTDENAAVYGTCEDIDENFGRLLAALDRLKLRENTIVLFLTDNGANTDRYNSGMKGRKGSVHEGGSRVPLWIQWKSHLPQPQVITQISSHIDLYPTLLELCGVTPPPGPAIDGISLVPLLKGTAKEWPERTLFAHNFRNGRVEEYPGAVRTPQYRLVHEQRPKDVWELYDMIADPGETNNLAAQKPELVARLSATYHTWYTNVTQDGFTRFPLPIGYAEENPVTLHAPQAYYTGAIQFYGINGFANDWLTKWTNPADSIYWEIEVAKAGRYDVTVNYLCPKESAGSQVQLDIGGVIATATTAGQEIRDIPLPHRAEKNGHTYVNRDWAHLSFGTLTLPAGKTRLTLQALSKPGEQVMDVKGVTLLRHD